MKTKDIIGLCFLVGSVFAGPVCAQQIEHRDEGAVSGLSASQLFDYAANAEAASDTTTAETIYVALIKDPDGDVKQEARFRLAKLKAKLGKFADAAVLLRAILDDKPDAQRVRLELAATLAQMGDLSGARRNLRQAQAGGLPPAVANIVDQYAAALRSAKPFVASIEFSLAPSNNINRATTANTLDTILAPLQLSDDARAKSGIGIKVGGQVLGRVPILPKTSAIVRLSGQGSFYKDSSFNDLVGSAQVGLETQWKKLQVRPLFGRSYRIYGNKLYATTNTASVSLTQTVGRRSQVEAEFGLGKANYRLNDLQDGLIRSASLTYEHAFSRRSGGSINFAFERQAARDPGYATKSGSSQILVWREAGKASLFASLSLSRLQADERLTLFPERRKEWQFRSTAGATLRQFTIAGFAPVIRASYERNQSTVGIYDYRRVAADVGITRAF